MNTKVILLIINLFTTSMQRSTPEDDHYVAAVLEYYSAGTYQENLQNYEGYITEAASKGADIIVFPELTLTVRESVPVPIHGSLKEQPIPALSPDIYHEILVRMSRAAQDAGIYIVVNLEEAMDCSNAPGELCPDRQLYKFNTNVVFDRNGAVIDRYRKINLFGEFSRSPALEPELGTFGTDFGVRFGHFTCFDIQFQVPGNQILTREGITDVIFPTSWISELPFLTAVQIFEAYAFANDVNFLVSGNSNVRSGAAGSGIFSGANGTLSGVMPGSNTRMLLVSRVPKIPGTATGSYPGLIPNQPEQMADLLVLLPQMADLFVLREPSMAAHASRFITPGVHEEFVLRDGTVTCYFNVTLNAYDQAQGYVWRASAFDGVRTYSGLASGGTRICALAACTAADHATCGTRFTTYSPDAQRFEKLSITAAVPTPNLDLAKSAYDSAYYPSTLDAAILPLTHDQFQYGRRDGGNETRIDMELVDYSRELLAFAIWGRFYDVDGGAVTPDRDVINDGHGEAQFGDDALSNQDTSTFLSMAARFINAILTLSLFVF